MPTLKETLLSDTNRPAVIADCVQLIDDQVKSKRGVAGMMVKGAYTVVTKLKPGIIREAVDHLLDDFVARLEPFYADFQAQETEPFEPYFTARARDVANALLGVTDARAERTKNKTIKKAYEKLRPTGVKHTEAAIPGLSRIVVRYV